MSLVVHLFLFPAKLFDLANPVVQLARSARWPSPKMLRAWWRGSAPAAPRHFSFLHEIHLSFTKHCVKLCILLSHFAPEDTALGKDMVPKRMFFTKGVGKHRERLTSFELALRDAGIAQGQLKRR